MLPAHRTRRGTAARTDQHPHKRAGVPCRGEHADLAIYEARLVRIQLRRNRREPLLGDLLRGIEDLLDGAAVIGGEAEDAAAAARRRAARTGQSPVPGDRQSSTCRLSFHCTCLCVGTIYWAALVCGGRAWRQGHRPLARSLPRRCSSEPFRVPHEYAWCALLYQGRSSDLMCRLTSGLRLQISRASSCARCINRSCAATSLTASPSP